jgi:excisionase family DNA binding protein
MTTLSRLTPTQRSRKLIQEPSAIQLACEYLQEAIRLLEEEGNAFPDVMTKEQAARYIRFSTRYVETLISQGKINSYIPPGEKCRLVNRADLEPYKRVRRVTR